MAILEIKDVSFTYSGQNHPALSGVSFSLEKGDFALLCGATGSGKSTLLKLLKKELTPLGELKGRVEYGGQSVYELPDAVSASYIGFVMQKSEQQIVTDKVWHELAFGLENLGLSSAEIRRRVAEMACFFGIESWFDKRVSELSGGQKQLLSLAAVMVMQPDILLLDEPTSQLDPIAAGEFISTVAKLNRELSLTVVMIEHRLEEALPISQKLIALREGRVYAFGETRKTACALQKDSEFLPYLPAAVRLHARFDTPLPCPLTVNEGRRFIEAAFDALPPAAEISPRVHAEGKALEFKNVYFRYAQKLPDVLRGTSFTLYENEILCVLGGNGSGKSTMLRIASGLSKPYAGHVSVFGKRIRDYKNQDLYKNCVALLPQDAQTVFLRNSVREELKGVDTSAFPFDLTELYDMHPYDLSGGQQQLLALAKVLSQKPRLLMLDEPTKGLDANTKAQFANIVRQLRQGGASVLIVTHDVEFAAEVADRCALFFLGEVVSSDETRAFFGTNSFYTTAVSRMTRDRVANLSTVDQACALLKDHRRRA